MVKTKIINLSSLHSLRSETKMISIFAEICDKYAPSAFNFCPSIFTHITNFSWVGFKFKENKPLLIDPYKLGKMETQEFLNRLLDVLSFLKDPNLQLLERDIARLNANKDSLFILRGISEPTQEDYVLALLEEAWNSIIIFNEEDLTKLQALLKDDSEIILISNTNHLNIERVLQIFKAQCNEILNFDNKEQGPIQITKNIALYPSYQMGAFKIKLEDGTPGVLQYVFNEVLKGNSEDLLVISQFPNDLKEAIRLGIPEQQTMHAKKYYQSQFEQKLKIA